jgi:tRNA(fMet)-specific endonuclease VapC
MYMLDTDTCSYVLKTKSAKLAKRFMVDVGKIAISEIVLAELRFGADNHQNRTEQIHDLIDDFIVRLEIIPWAASVHYGKLRAMLQNSGTPIGNMDTLIAAHALSQDSILVTNNTKHFRRVPGLKIDNWL